MTISLPAGATALTLALMAATTATATTLVDFTDTARWSDKDTTATTSASYGAFTVSLTSVPENRLDFTQAFDGKGTKPYCAVNSGPLACLSDGLGVAGDEITFPDQSVTVTFTTAVNVTGLHFLDLFFARNSDDSEKAKVIVNGDTTAPLTFLAKQMFQNAGGYSFEAIFLANVSTLTFFAGAGNDAVGSPDFALAGIEASPVPLPAAAWLLIAGLGGLGLVARQRKNAAA